MSDSRSEVTRILDSIQRGDPQASQDLLPLVYEELRQLAAARMAREPAGHTLQPTALVHEAFLRLVEGDGHGWNSRGHFFGAAAEAMRRILIERARRKGRLKHGGGRQREELGEPLADLPAEIDLLDLDAAIERLAGIDPRKAELVKLRFFAGLSVAETAEVLDRSPTTVKADWAYARAWLARELDADAG